MGRHLTTTLLRDTDFVVGLLNRGRTLCPFDVDNRRLFHHRCDRFDRRRFRQVLQTTGPWDFVVDFLCFRRRHAHDVVQALWPPAAEGTSNADSRKRQRNLTSTKSSQPTKETDSADSKSGGGGGGSSPRSSRRGGGAGGGETSGGEAGGGAAEGPIGDAHSALKLYILISTDSVYMACAPPRQTTGVRESDAVRPQSHADRAAVAARDRYQQEYGGNKLKAEEFLQKEWARCRFPFMALRLPDVIGPFDNLTGFLGLRHRLLRKKRIGLRIGACCESQRCDGRTHRISVVYAPDVANVIKQICVRCQQHAGDPRCVNLGGAGGVVAGDALISAVRGQAFNVACRETPTFEKFVQGVALMVGAEGQVRWAPQRSAPMVTVEMGALDTARARHVLGFEATPLADVLTATAKWCSEARNRKYTRDLDKSSSSDEEGEESAGKGGQLSSDDSPSDSGDGTSSSSTSS
jgi:nucleoside-diphosphate-sugar epimerase